MSKLQPPPDAKHVQVVDKESHKLMWEGTREQFIKEFCGGLDEDNQKSYVMISHM